MTESSGSADRDWGWYIDGEGEAIQRTWRAFAEGRIPWDDLDEEELQRLQLRSRNGDWSGNRYARQVPPELRRAVLQHGVSLMQSRDLAIALASQTMRASLVVDTMVDPAIRLRAGERSEDRIRGKVPDKVELTAEIRPWEQIIDAIVVDVPAVSA